MTIIRIRGLKRYTHPKTGRTYIYHRATGTRLTSEPGTPEFLAEIAKLDAGKKPKEPAPGTIGMTIKAYRKCPAWADLRPATRISYDRAFQAIANIEGMPLVDIDRPFMVGLQERIYDKRGRWMANYVVTSMSILFEYAMDRGWMKGNPADGVKRLKRDRSKPHQNRPWTRQESRTVLSAAAPYLQVPIALAMFTGLRKGDVLKVTKAAMRDGMIQVTTSKRDVPVMVPMHPELLEVLAQAPRHDAVTIAANLAGRPWTESGFNSTFFKAIVKLEEAGMVEPGLTMHGLRHTLGTRLREAGADLDDIRRVLGQKTLVMAQHYSEGADTSEKARTVVTKLDLTGPKKGT